MCLECAPAFNLLEAMRCEELAFNRLASLASSLRIHRNFLSLEAVDNQVGMDAFWMPGMEIVIDNGQKEESGAAVISPRPHSIEVK